MNNRPAIYTDIVKAAARRAGFSYCGISNAAFLEPEARHLETWLKKGMHGKMQYMENNFDKRTDPRRLVEGARSVITLLYNYYQPQEVEPDNRPRISMYAQGEDYHFVVKDRLKLMTDEMQKQIGIFSFRYFTDSAPVMDKAWAVRSGAGWQGKNANIIHKKMGSYFFIAEIICDLDLIPNNPVSDHCGSCTACIDACPTQAIVQPHVVDGSRCISYFTIELKDEKFPDDMQAGWSDWIFGCDICQMVCPWNRFATPTHEDRFKSQWKNQLLSYAQWENLTEEKFSSVFSKSPLKRAGYGGIKRNVQAIKKSGKNNGKAKKTDSV